MSGLDCRPSTWDRQDENKSGWWQLFALIPLAGWLVLTIFFLLPGEPDSNRFGQPEVL